MDIGGVDYLLEVDNDNAFNIVVNYMKKYWPNALFQSVEAESYVSIDKAEDCDEFFIYQDQAAWDLWELDLPGEKEDQNKMFYFILQYACVTLVVDEESPEILKVVDKLVELLKNA